MRHITILSLAAVAASSFAQFSAGNLAVAVVGDGQTPTSGNLGISVRQFTTAGSQVGSDLSLINLSGGRNITTTYGETSEANITLSGDGRFFMLGGYDLSVRNAGFNTINSDRAVARIDMNGGVDVSTAFKPASGDGVRAVYSADGTDYIATGGDMGLLRGSFPGAPTQVVSGFTSSRTVKAFGSGFMFNGSNAFQGGNGFAFFDGTNVTELFGTPNGASARDFEVVNSTTLYLATSSANTGLVKMTFDGSAWVQSYGLTGTALSGVAFDGNSVYATSSDGTRLMVSTDTGSGFTAWSTLATASANTRFRGVEVVPEPGTMIALGAGVAALASRRRRK
ncbi:MAG: PEP-CTERM sorting domain-containing protein [Fimbriimonadaceae bacterium]|nr:PEP-CTERM sorting domain-containing protein [Fimbriimonadaceae bacterium]QYK57093.1 MAG: PEP-CTERM sorting domain-containing protein [Fimbriimonadaceae bacterium]